MIYLQFSTQDLTLSLHQESAFLEASDWVLDVRAVRYLDNKTYYADVWHVRSNNNKPVSARLSLSASAHSLISLENNLPSYQPAWLHCDWVLK